MAKNNMDNKNTKKYNDSHVSIYVSCDGRILNKEATEKLRSSITKIYQEEKAKERQNIKPAKGKMKYKLLKEDFIEKGGKKLYRIQALKDFGYVAEKELGGYIESEANLSQEGNCWVYGDAKVYDEAKVFDNARVFDNAVVCGNAIVFGHAEIFGKAEIFGNTVVSSSSSIRANYIVSYDNKNKE